jgi:hypothetical protein
VDERHGVVVVGPVRSVGVDHHVRVPGREKAVEAGGSSEGFGI